MTHSRPAPTPRRILLVSADIGEGHNATARAVEDAAERLWPGCDVRWLDTLRIMGPGVGPLFRWIYVQNVETTPWLYNTFYDALWRMRWFADASRRFVGAWSGRLLRGPIERFDPDLIVSTYPMGTAGLDRLRRRGGLDMPVAAIVSDFSPHPFWVYSEIDQHYVMSQASLREMYRAQPDARGAVSVPPVVPAFSPADKQAARRETGLPEQGFVVLVSCGSLGFGSVERAVDTALSVEGVDRVVVACGRNHELHTRLNARSQAGDRLLALGWVDGMAALTTAADVVVSNAGGATALEALACGRTVVMFEPIAGHGRGNAELMADAGLAELCPTTTELAGTLHRLSTDADFAAETEHRALRHARSGDFIEQVRELAELPRHHGTRSLRARDAFFVHAATPAVPQQTGTILRLEGAPPNWSAHEWKSRLAWRMHERAPQLTMLRLRMLHRKVRRPAWRLVEHIDPDEHLDFREVGTGGHSRAAVVREFFSEPVPTDRPPWQITVLRDNDTGGTDVLAKLHHALGDGIAVTGTLLRLLQDDEPRLGEPHRSTATDVEGRWTRRAKQVSSAGRGLLSLVRAGSAPPSPLDGPSTPQRGYGWVELSSAKVRASARAHHVPGSVLLLTLVAEALHRVLDEREGTDPGQQLRVMVPRTTRSLRSNRDAYSPGNRTVAVSVDLPVGPMAPSERVRKVSAVLDSTRQGGQTLATGAVMAALGLLPDPLHAWVVRRIYQRRFFNVIISALPGARRSPYLQGARVTGVLPVLPLASGVGLAVGAITWGDMVGVGITADARLDTLPHHLVDHLRAAFDDLQDLAGRDSA